MKFLLEADDIEKTKPRACAFTGHRELGEDFSARKLKKEIKKRMEEDVEIFFNGMASGFDLLAAEYVLALKKKFENVKLIACIPCPEQDKYFSKEDKIRYSKILKKADEVNVLSESYYRGCMQKRNRFMVDRADLLIAYCNKEEGGTAYTVKYFKKVKGEENIIFV